MNALVGTALRAVRHASVATSVPAVRQTSVGTAVPAVRLDRSPAVRRARSGQTPTEYLMIAGIMTAIGIFVLLWMFQPWRKTAQDVADCVREDNCEATNSQ